MFRRALVAAFLGGLACGAIEGQRTTPSVDPEAQQQAMQRQKQREQNAELTYEQLKHGGKTADQNKPALDKATLDRIKQFRKIDPEIAGTYSVFLKTPGTGIVKFFPDNGCRSSRVISGSDKCSNFVPQSNAFSFRRKTYDYYYGDIAFQDSAILAGSFFSQGAILALGDLPIEGVD